MERRDIRQLKDALHAAELDNISFGCANICITTMSGQVLNAEPTLSPEGRLSAGKRT